LRGLRLVSNGLCAWILLLLVTGGWVWKSRIGDHPFTAEFAQLDLWSVALLGVTLIQVRLAAGRVSKDLGWLGKAWWWLCTRLASPRASVNAARVLAVSFGLLLFLAHFLRHASLATHGFDMSFVHQPLFYPWGDGKLLRADMSDSGTTLSSHLVFSFFLLAPVTAWLHSDTFIFLLQAVLIIGGAYCLAVYGPLKKDRRLAWAALALFLFHRALRNSVVWDFREDGLAYAGLIIMILASLRGKILYYVAGLLLALASKENIFVMTVATCFPLVFSRDIPLSRNERAGWVALTLVGSAVYAWLSFKVLFPHFSAGMTQSLAMQTRYGKFGSTPSEIVSHILFAPSAWLELAVLFFKKSSIKYVLLLFGSVAFFFRGREAWVWLVPALLGTAMNLSNDYAIGRQMIFHYELIVLPFLFTAALEGMKTIETRRTWFWGLLIALCFFDRSPMLSIRNYFPTEAQWRAHEMLKHLPDSAPVAVDQHLSAQVNQLPALRVLGTPSENWTPPAAIYVLDDGVAPEAAKRNELLLAGWRETDSADGIHVLIKGL
jgi:uncharacterized membrane protein